MHAIAQAEFDGFPESKAPADENPVAQYLRLWGECGGLIPQFLLPSALGLSNGRISQFIGEKRFEVHQIGGKNFVTGRSFEAFLEQERKTGRPVKQKSFTQLVKEGWVQAKDEESQRKV